MELSTQDETIRARLVTIFALLRAPFEENLRAAIDAGEIPEIDVQETAEAMIAYMEGCMLMANTRNDPELFRTLAPRLTRLCVPPSLAKPAAANLA